MTRGLVWGKFLPPHKGHLYVVQEACKKADELHVLVCSVEREPIPGYLRYEWMRRLCHDYANKYGSNCIVHHINEGLPQLPDEHPNFWALWKEAILRTLPAPPDVVFTSEDHGDQLAELLGAKHQQVDKARVVVPVSGTAIRNNPLQQWAFIPDIVRPYFAKRIVLIGPESTGKSTLTRQLAEHFHTNYVEEYGRDYFVRKGGIHELRDLSHIAAGHLQAEEEAAAHCNGLLICDTDIVATKVWSEIYFGYAPQWLVRQAEQHVADLYLLTDIDIPWQDDGTREFPHARQQHFQRFRAELERRRLPYILLRGKGAERLQNAIDALQTYLDELTTSSQQ